MMKIKNLKNLDYVYKVFLNLIVWVMFSILKFNIVIGVVFFVLIF